MARKQHDGDRRVHERDPHERGRSAAHHEDGDEGGVNGDERKDLAAHRVPSGAAEIATHRPSYPFRPVLRHP